MLKHITLLGICILIGALTTGCVASQNKRMTLVDAYSSRANKNIDQNKAARFFGAKCQKKTHRDYSKWGMEYASACMSNGNYDAAFKEMMGVRKSIVQQRSAFAEGVAAVGREDLKPFKGEPFERAMLGYYLGMIHYISADYNNARIFFAQAIEADNTTAENMAKYRNDLRLAHYWMGRSFLQLGKSDNARIAFTKATEKLDRKRQARFDKSFAKGQKKLRKKRLKLEATSFKNASRAKVPIPGATDMTASPSMVEMPALLGAASTASPILLSTNSESQFFTPEYQKEVNLTIMIELGNGPVKVVNEYGDKILPVQYPDRQTVVYIDGHQAGKSFQLVDLFHQASTRGRSGKDNAQIGKAITKQVLSYVPYVGGLADYWNIMPDYRYWQLLPGEVHVFAAKVKPGLHTINIKAFDVNGYLLPRYGVTRYHVPVVAGQDNVYMIPIQREADNVYVAQK